MKELNIILKADVQARSKYWAICWPAVERQSAAEVAAVGYWRDHRTDVLLASASNAIIIGFNVRRSARRRNSPNRKKSTYGCTRSFTTAGRIKRAMTGLLEPTIKETYQGRADVLEPSAFRRWGRLRLPRERWIDQARFRSALLRQRGGVQGKVASLRRFKDDASQ